MSLPFDEKQRTFGLTPANAAIKRGFDILVALILLVTFGWLIVILAILARLDTGLSGIFRQTRVGLFGEPFTLFKLRSMRPVEGIETTVTTRDDPRITKLGKFLRRSKADELPQLMNVLIGNMSFVGPRPDVASMYQDLDAASLRVLTVRPGITGPASLRFKNEEELLAAADEPEIYNKDVLIPEKIRLNLEYIDHYSIFRDIILMIRTVFG